MKCFRINEGAERFWYAAETQEAAMAEHRSTFEDEDDEVDISEVTDAEMEKVTIDTTDGNDYPDGSATLKQIFHDSCDGGIDGALPLASSVY